MRNLNYINLKLAKSNLTLIILILIFTPIISYGLFKIIIFPLVICSLVISSIFNIKLAEDYNNTILLSLPIKRSTIKLNTIVIDTLSLLLASLYNLIVVFVVSGFESDFRFVSLSVILGIAICLMIFILRNVSSRLLSHKRYRIFSAGFLPAFGYAISKFLNFMIKHNTIPYSVMIIPGFLFFIYLFTYIGRLSVLD